MVINNLLLKLKNRDADSIKKTQEVLLSMRGKIDVLIAETITETERDHVTLRGIEIKVNLNDLKSDHKMAEYTDFVDYFYIANHYCVFK